MLVGEIRKWFCHKSFIGILVSVLLFQIAYFGWNIFNSEEFCDYQGYQKLSGKINNENRENIQKNLDEKLAPENLYQMGSITPEYTESVSEEETLYRVVLKELKQINGYSEYLEQVTDEKGMSVSIFNQSNYLDRDREVTAQVYSRLQGTETEYGGNYGCYLFTYMGLDDIFCIVLFLLIAVSVVTTEREKETVLLLRIMPKGQKKVSIVKYIWGAILSFGVTFIFYGIKLLLIIRTYGLGDLSVAVQGAYGMKGTPFIISVGEYLLLFLLLKLIIGELLYSFMFLMASCFRSSLKVYGVSLLVLAIEYVLYALIEKTNIFVALHDFNVFSLWNSMELLNGYHNVNFFGKPLSYFLVCQVVVCILLIVFSVVGVFKNSHFRILECAKTEELVGKTRKIRRLDISSVLTLGEFKKCWICEKGLYLLGLSILFLLLFSTSVKEDLSSDEKAYYKEYIQQVEGKYTEDKMAMLLAEEERLEILGDKMAQTGITDDARQVFQDDLRRMAGLETVVSYGKYLQEHSGLSFVYSSGYQRLLNGEEGRWNRILRNIIAVFLMVGISVSAWGIEEWSGMRQIIQISRSGWVKVWNQKIKIILVNGIIVFCVIYLPGIFQILSEYGCANILEPIQSIQEYEMLPKQLNILSVVILFYFLHLIVIWGVGFVSGYIQKKMKSQIGSTIAAVLLCGAVVLFVSV